MKQSKKEQALQAKLEAAFVESIPSLCRTDQDAIRDTMIHTHERVGMGLHAPKEAPIAWGFRAIQERDGRFSLLHDRQLVRVFGIDSIKARNAFALFVDLHVTPILQRHHELMGRDRTETYHHFKWDSPMGVVRAATTTHCNSGYVYGVVWLEAV
jgi:hypothetical protein